jgi:hypothetical protein
MHSDTIRANIVVLDRHGLTVYGEGSGGGPNRDGDAGGSEPFMR